MDTSPLEWISQHPGSDFGVSLFVKRDDLLHPDIPGNKWRKLAPIINLVRHQYPSGLVTFGGPFSNHLRAVAAAGRLFHIRTFGIVRGTHADPNNPTLQAAQNDGMMLFPISKAEYDACKNRGEELLGQHLPNYYILPEGGATPAGVDNCASIAREIQAQLAKQAVSWRRLFVCVPAGTGCTAAGIVAGLEVPNAHVLVFPVVNRGFDSNTILDQITETHRRSTTEKQTVPLEQRFSTVYDYELGGFAKMPPPLRAFVYLFRDQTGILLDPVYTAKMLFGVYDMLANGFFPPDSAVVAVHTGGLQGWGGIGM